MNPPHGLTLAAAAFGMLGGLAAALARHLPSEQDLPVILTHPQIQVEARYLGPGVSGEDYARHAVCRCGLRLPADQIPPFMKQALLAQEDVRFYVHSGVDWIGLVRAFASIASGGAIQGGSTLTQQLVKNLITGNARSGFDGVMRKIREAVIARRVERVMTKEEILAAYLSQTDFGSSDGTAAIGIVQAARKYFGKPVKDLNLHEAATLVGMLRATSVYNPIANPEAADRQAQAVLAKMLDQGRISRETYLRALRQGDALPNRDMAPVPVATGYYVAWARPELAAIAAAHPSGGMMRFVIGLDPWRQAQAEAAVRYELAAHGGRRHVSQGALVAVAGDGRVNALVGGADFAKSQFDRATRATRQPGSAFKLFVYTAAVNSGLGPNSIRPDEPVTINGWKPENVDHQFRGPITLRTAFAASRNTVAARLGEEIGTGAIVRLARELGITAPLHPDPSLALGTSEVTLLELTSAYAPFMNEGRPVRPYAALIALDGKGEVVWRRDRRPFRTVVNGRTLDAMRDMLHAVVTEGTGRQAGLHDGRWSAGKTGTTQGNRDAWFIGFTDRLTTGVWFGNDDNSPMTDVAGAGMPARAWRDFNEAIDARPFPDSGAGMAANTAIPAGEHATLPESRRRGRDKAFSRYGGP